MPILIPITGASYPGDIFHRTRVPMSLVITDEDALRFGHSKASLRVSDIFQYPAKQVITVSGKTRRAANQVLEISGPTKNAAFQSLLVGGPSITHAKHSLEVVGGDSFLIIADIVSKAMSDDVEAANNIQIIYLDGADGGFWRIWLNYAGQVLETELIDFDATAFDVKVALDALANVPNEDCIVVTGSVGGPFEIEFTEAMGHRFINPLIIDTLELEGADNPMVEVSVPGRTVGSFMQKEVTGELKINGVVTEFKDAQYQQPANKLGSLLNIRLAHTYLNQLPRNSTVEFALVARVAGQEARKVLVRNGKLQGREYRLAYRQGVGSEGGPVDELSFSSIDVIADKFSLAPRRPIVMYDPQKVDFKSVELKPRDAIVDEYGSPILPVYEPVMGLTMKTVLQRAYTGIGGHNLTSPLNPVQLASGISSYFSSPSIDQKGLGFGSVVTNIPNYPVKKATWDIEGSFHSGGQPFIGMYNPMYLPYFETLFVINTQFPLPFGALARIVPTSKPKSLTQTLPFQPDTNAILLTYQVSAQEEDAENIGLFFEYEEERDQSENQKTFTRTLYQRKKDLTTLEVLAEVIDEVYKETRTSFGGGTFTLSHTETTKNFYQDDLKTGYRKDVESLVLTGPSRSASLVPILREENECTWVEDPFNIGTKILAKSVTRVTGLIYILTKTETRYDPNTGDFEVPMRYPLIVAQASGMLGDEELEGAISEAFVPIETTTETLRRIGGNQFDVEVVTLDEITGGLKRSITAPRTGDTSSNPYEMRAKTMLRRDRTSEADIGPRVPLSINTGELPRDRAISLADLTLYRAHNPLSVLKLPLLEVDFGIEKGTVLIGQTREGYTKRHITIAIDMNIQGGPNPKTVMSVDAQELPELI